MIAKLERAGIDGEGGPWLGAQVAELTTGKTTTPPTTPSQRSGLGNQWRDGMRVIDRGAGSEGLQPARNGASD